MIRHFLDLGILLSRQVILGFALLAALCFLLGRTGVLDRSRRSPTFSRLLLVLSCLLAVTFGAVGLWYLGQEGFAGEVEPLVSSLSWVLQDGQALYHPLDGPEQYSLLYGPSAFLTNGLMLRVLGPTIFSAKLASVLAGIGTLLLVFATVGQSAKDRLAWLAVAASVLLFWAHGFGVYLVRPDALLVFSSAFALYVVHRASPRLGILGLAAILGFAINLKVHGGFYFLPVLYLAGARWGRRALLVILALAAALAVAPFALFPEISLANYLAWLSNARQHGLDTREATLVLRFLFLAAMPLGILVARLTGRLSLLRKYRGLGLAVAAGLAPVLVLAAKPGAGPVHLLPFVPVVVCLPALVWREVRPGIAGQPWLRPARSQALVAGAMATVLLAGVVNGYRATMLVSWHMSQESGLADEVRGIMARYPDLDIAMACGGENASFRHTWVRPLLVFADHPLLVDPISIMDCCLAGRELPPATHGALTEGVIDLWLVPSSETPFEKANWYAPHDPIFPRTFQDEFQQCYDRRDRTASFDLWFWKKLPDGIPARPDWAKAVAGAGEVLSP